MRHRRGIDKLKSGCIRQEYAGDGDDGLILLPLARIAGHTRSHLGHARAAPHTYCAESLRLPRQHTAHKGPQLGLSIQQLSESFPVTVPCQAALHRPQDQTYPVSVN